VADLLCGCRRRLSTAEPGLQPSRCVERTIIQPTITNTTVIKK
jgi:hypothetical protein